MVLAEGSQRQYCGVVNNLGLWHSMSLAFSSSCFTSYWLTHPLHHWSRLFTISTSCRGLHYIMHASASYLSSQNMLENKNKSRRSVLSFQTCLINILFWSNWISKREKQLIPHSICRSQVKMSYNHKCKS